VNGSVSGATTVTVTASAATATSSSSSGAAKGVIGIGPNGILIAGILSMAFAGWL